MALCETVEYAARVLEERRKHTQEQQEEEARQQRQIERGLEQAELGDE